MDSHSKKWKNPSKILLCFLDDNLFSWLHFFKFKHYLFFIVHIYFFIFTSYYLFHFSSFIFSVFSFRLSFVTSHFLFSILHFFHFLLFFTFFLCFSSIYLQWKKIRCLVLRTSKEICFSLATFRLADPRTSVEDRREIGRVRVLQIQTDCVQ